MENNTFTILPMSQRFALEPGQTYKGKLSIVNPSDASEDFPYRTSIMPYNVVGSDYTADLSTQYNRSMITEWITIEEPTGVVKPNETKELEFTITVPGDAPAGGQYAAIAVASNPGQSENEGVAVQSIFEMASLIYGTVAGETKHEGTVLENNVPGFSTTSLVTLSALISNDGNVHEDATFVISVSNFFTGEVILPNDENDGHYSEIIMPETTRQVEREVSNLPALGVVKVNQTIYYQGQTPSIVEKNIIICPIWFIVLLILTIAAIITTVVLIVKKHRRNKKAKRAMKDAAI